MPTLSSLVVPGIIGIAICGACIQCRQCRHHDLRCYQWRWSWHHATRSFHCVLWPVSVHYFLAFLEIDLSAHQRFDKYHCWLSPATGSTPKFKLTVWWFGSYWHNRPPWEACSKKYKSLHIHILAHRLSYSTSNSHSVTTDGGGPTL